MTVFARKLGMNVVDWGPIQDRLAQLQIALGAPHDLMMFSSDSEEQPGVQDIYVGLPEKALLSAFPGFQEINRADIPDYLATLIVREDKFGERFPDIAAKRRTKYGS